MSSIRRGPAIRRGCAFATEATEKYLQRFRIFCATNGSNPRTVRGPNPGRAFAFFAAFAPWRETFLQASAKPRSGASLGRTPRRKDRKVKAGIRRYTPLGCGSAALRTLCPLWQIFCFFWSETTPPSLHGTRQHRLPGQMSFSRRTATPKAGHTIGSNPRTVRGPNPGRALAFFAAFAPWRETFLQDRAKPRSGASLGRTPRRKDRKVKAGIRRYTPLGCGSAALRTLCPLWQIFCFFWSETTPPSFHGTLAR